MLKLHVVWYNSAGCELASFPVASMKEATDKVIDMCQTGTLEPGDTIRFSELVV